jgi:hypothetical protein
LLAFNLMIKYIEFKYSKKISWIFSSKSRWKRKKTRGGRIEPGLLKRKIGQ